MKKLARIQTSPEQHWVGDGFPVRSMFSYRDVGEFDPFLLLDYAGPTEFAPSDRPRGVEQHPHRGFETVTIVYEGEVEHRDSSGGGGRIGPGDVQWMTAAAGLVHEEMHGREFTRRGGRLEMVQLWVNLPAKDKLSRPGYQSIAAAQIPSVQLPDAAGSVRVIAGGLNGVRGPARTFTPINVWDVQLAAGGKATLPVPEGHTTLALVLDGDLRIGNGQHAKSASIAVFERQGDSIDLAASEPTRVLILDGAPLQEPIAAYGPFVMNTDAEIRQALDDYRAGRMGRLDA